MLIHCYLSDGGKESGPPTPRAPVQSIVTPQPLLLPVALHVVFEQRAEREANTATDGADVGLLSGVPPQASRPCGSRCELPVQHLDVCLQVQQQVLSHTAEAVLVVGVDFYVVHQKSSSAGQGRPAGGGQGRPAGGGQGRPAGGLNRGAAVSSEEVLGRMSSSFRCTFRASSEST